MRVLVWAAPIESEGSGSGRSRVPEERKERGREREEARSGGRVRLHDGEGKRKEEGGEEMAAMEMVLSWWCLGFRGGEAAAMEELQRRERGVG